MQDIKLGGGGGGGAGNGGNGDRVPLDLPSFEDAKRLDELLTTLVWRHVLAAALISNGTPLETAYSDVDEFFMDEGETDLEEEEEELDSERELEEEENDDEGPPNGAD